MQNVNRFTRRVITRAAFAAFCILTCVLLGQKGEVFAAPLAPLTVTQSDIVRLQRVETKALGLCEALRWRIDYEQRRIRNMVESNGIDSYEWWPEDTDVSQAIEPEQLLQQFDPTLGTEVMLQLLDDAERRVRDLDDISFLHFVWEWPINLLQIYPGCYLCEYLGLSCSAVAPFWNPCEAATNWMDPTLQTYWTDSTTFHIFIVIPSILNFAGIPWQTQLDMIDYKILIGLFRPIIGSGGSRALTWSGIHFSVIAGFDIVGGTQQKGGVLQVESPPILNLSLFVWNRFRDGTAQVQAGQGGQGGGVYTNSLSFNVFVFNEIQDNTAEDVGGGFYADQGSINLLVANEFTDNHSDVRGGGLTFHQYSLNYLHANKVKDNNAPIGGGIYFDDNFPIIAVRNHYDGNAATAGPGGGMYDRGLRVAHYRERFSSNQSATVSGAYHRPIHEGLPSNDYVVRGWRFDDNYAPERGGAFWIRPNEFDDVIIQDCKFDGNWSDIEGGAIWVPSDRTDLEFTDCKFLANHSPVGGAIFYVKDPSLTATVLLDHSRFGANYSTAAHGGACYFQTDAGPMTVTVTNSIFDAINQVPTPYFGGGLFTDGPETHLFILDSKFEGNVATRSGAVWADSIAEFRVVNSEFSENYARQGGGAIWYRDGDYDNFTIVGSNFQGNSCEDNGGALWINNQANIDISTTAFSSNQADSGGAIAINDSSTEIRLFDDDFFSNVAQNVGGALYVAPGTDVDTLANCVFSGNIANGSSVLAAIDNGLGGGIYIHSESYDEDILSCDFIGNDAIWGGGIALDTFRVPFRIVGCRFVGNGADRGEAGVGCGGGIFINGPFLDIIIGTPATEDSNYFERNYAEDGGGIAVYNGSSPIIQNNNFQSNKADRNGDGYGMGGGILTHEAGTNPWIGGNAVLNEDNTFAYNVAGTPPPAVRQGRGGAIGIRRSSSPLIQGNHLYFNGATYAGAGIADSANVVDTTVIGGINDDEIILSMDVPVPFGIEQFGNRIFNDCVVPIEEPPLPPPPDTPVDDGMIHICCCYGPSDGPSFEVPFPPVEGWRPDSTFRYPEETLLDFTSCIPIVEIEDEAIADGIESHDWPSEWTDFCFEWPDDTPLWPDTSWVPDTTSWATESPGGLLSWGETLVEMLRTGTLPRQQRRGLDDDYFPTGLGMLEPCTIQGAYVPLFGGGVSIEGVAKPTIFGNLIDHNCADSIGGGVWVDGTITGARVGLPDTLTSAPTTDHKNFIQRNAAPYGGGVGCADYSWSVFENNIVGGRTDSLGNLACQSGGGFFITVGAYPDVGDTSLERNNLVQHNKAYYNFGGGFAIDTVAHPVLMGNRIFNNRAGDRSPWAAIDTSIADGGGIGIDSTNPVITYNWVIDNFSADEGGGISSKNCWGTIDHNTIALNDAFNDGAGVQFKGFYKPVFTNNNIVCYGPWESSGVFSVDGLLPAVFTNNNVHSRFGQRYFRIEPDATGYDANVSYHPHFADEAADDYRLASNSPLLGLGTGGSDIGWNYGIAAAVTIDTFMVTSGDTIQYALDSASFGDFVLVDSGVYFENLTIPSGVALRSIWGADSTVIVADTFIFPVITGDSLHHITSVSGFSLRGAVVDIELSGNSRPYLFANVVDSCDTGVVQRDTAVAWIQNNTFDDLSIAVFGHDSLQVLSHNIFDSGTALDIRPVTEYPDSYFVHTRRNDFASGGLYTNQPNLAAAPMFVSPTMWDYHLIWGSLCLAVNTQDTTLVGCLDFERRFDLICDTLLYGAPGDTVGVPFLLSHHEDDSTRTFYIWNSDSLGWPLDPDSLLRHIPASTDCVFTINVVIPFGATVGTIDTIISAAWTVGSPGNTDTAKGFVEVVSPLAATADLTISLYGEDIVLRWNRFAPVGHEYLIYTYSVSERAPVLMARTHATSFTDKRAVVFDERKFYFVSAMPPDVPLQSKPGVTKKLVSSWSRRK